MNLLSSKYLFKVGLITGAIIIIYQFINLLLIYKYFKFEYYIAGAVIIALVTGVLLTRKYYREKLSAASEHNQLDNLTANELRVLELIANGKSNKEIASLNYTEISTVKTHINNIFFKLDVNNRKDAAKVYITHQNMQKSTFSPPATT